LITIDKFQKPREIEASFFDQQFFISEPNHFLAGVDEVGRGPVAGPVVTCAVGIAQKDYTDDLLQFLLKLGINDSKKLSIKKREQILKSLNLDISSLNPHQVFTINILGASIQFSLATLGPEVIDQINILQAAKKAMAISVNEIQQLFSNLAMTVLVDGNQRIDLEHEARQFTIVKGDSKSILIALASIIAKEYRDHQMKLFSLTYPGYGLERHAGYPTKSHLDAIKSLGITPIHRKSFKGVKEYVK